MMQHFLHIFIHISMITIIYNTIYIYINYWKKQTLNSLTESNYHV